MADRDTHRLTYEVSEQEIRTALGVKNFCADYNGDGYITGISLRGQTLTPREVMERVDAEREARHGYRLAA